MGTLIDTSVIVAFERGELTAKDWPRGDDEIALSVITVSELLHGLERATPLRRARREQFLKDLFETVPTMDIDVAIARVHAQLTAQLAMQKTPIGVNDSWIAASALSLGYSVATRNVREFERVDGLRVERW